MQFKEWLESVYIGEKGLDKSWQKKFQPTTKCSKCGGTARIAFVNYESHGSRHICDLHKNIKNSMWPHDATATAVYFCKKCLEPTAVMNQA